MQLLSVGKITGIDYNALSLSLLVLSKIILVII